MAAELPSTIKIHPSGLAERARTECDLFAACFEFARLARLDLDATIALAEEFRQRLLKERVDAFLPRCVKADQLNRERGIDSDFEARYASR